MSRLFNFELFITIVLLYSSEHPVDERRPPESIFFFGGEGSSRSHEGGFRSLDVVMEELASLATRQAELVARARYDIAEEDANAEGAISTLEKQLAAVQAELASSKAEQLVSKAELERVEAELEKVAAEKTAVTLELEKERATAKEREAATKEALELFKAQHLANVDAFGRRFEDAISNAEERLRKISIEYDEELYPHLVQSVAERR